MTSATVRVRGLRETVRAFSRFDKRLAKEVRDELKRAAEPVAKAARGKISRYGGASLTTIRPRVGRGSTVFVTQHAKKVTGLRGDFGALQLRRGFIPALEENEGQVVRGVEEALDRLTASEGF